MLKGRNMIGQSIIAYATGEKVAQVRDIIFDYHKNQVLGFLVVEGGWLRPAKVVAVDAIQSIGPDSIIITSNQAVVDLEQVPEIQAVMEDDKTLINAKVMTADGHDLGTILDLYFDDQTWIVHGYEASGGFFADIYSGRSFIPAPQTLEIGKDYAFVEPEVAQKMEAQVGSLEAQLHQMGEKIQETSTAAGEQFQEISKATAEKLQAVRDVAGGTLKSTQQAMGEKVATLMPHPTLEQTQGKRVRKEVLTETGHLIAVPGQIVTDQVIAQAQAAGLEQELIQAVELPPADSLRSEAGNVLQKAQKNVQNLGHTTGEQVHQGIHSLQEGGHHLWQQARGQLKHLQQGAAHALEERRINAALGRHVNRTILDQHDTVILKQGDLITHQAIDRAREANVLDLLLHSLEKQSSKGFASK